MIVSTAKLADIAEIIAGQSPPSSTYNKNGICYETRENERFKY